MEEVEHIADIKHPLIRETLRLLGWEDLRLESTSMADIAARAGLGSSGSVTTALLKAVHVQIKL
jgi:D-glycero-alpha-D-manno-heptose-7-phosphate kinase